jgi:adhesin HecA-like repeat protein
MSTIIQNFLRVDYDLSIGNTYEYNIVNDISQNNILNLYFFLNTNQYNNSVTITIYEFDISNVLQDTIIYTINKNNSNLKKDVSLNTVNTSIIISYPGFIGSLSGIFEKTINGASETNNLAITSNDINVNGDNILLTGNTLNVDGLIFDISGQCVDISGQRVDISGQRVDISGQSVIVTSMPSFSVTSDISGQRVDISGQSVVVQGGIDISGQRVDISGQSVVVQGGIDISGQRVDISGQTVVVQGGIDISGQRVDISGQTVVVQGGIDISGQRVDISGQTVVVQGGIDISGQRVDISGQRVDISGQTVIVQGGIDISGQRVDISGQSVVITSMPPLTVTSDISGQTVDISGQSVVITSMPPLTVTSDISGQYVINNDFQLQNISDGINNNIQYSNAKLNAIDGLTNAILNNNILLITKISVLIDELIDTNNKVEGVQVYSNITNTILNDINTNLSQNKKGSRGNINNNINISSFGVSSSFNCNGFGTNSVISHQDSSIDASGEIIIFASENSITPVYSFIEIITPIVVGSYRYASKTINLAPFKLIYIQSNSISSINNCYTSVFSA